MLEIMQEAHNQLKSNQESGKIYSQPTMSHQPPHQSNQQKTAKKSTTFKTPSVNTKVQSSSTSQSLYSKQRPPVSHNNPQQRQVKPAPQRSLSSSVKITRKPELDYSPFRQDGRRSFSSSSRSSWDERFNALSQSLKDICGSPKHPSPFTRSATMTCEMQVGRERKSQRPQYMDSLTVPSASGITIRPKRGSDPHLRPKVTTTRDSRNILDGATSRTFSSRSSAPSTSIHKSNPRGNKNGVRFAPTQPIIIKGADNNIVQMTDDQNILRGNNPSPREGANTEIKNYTEQEVTQDCPDNLPGQAGIPAGHLSPQHEEDDPHLCPKSIHHLIPSLPPFSPRYSFSLPGSNFSSPGNTLAKSNSGLARPKAQMRRINSVFLENIQQPIFLIDPSFKKITLRHEESSRSLELELARVLFSNLNQSLNGRKESINEGVTDLGSITYPIRSEFLYKVAIKPHMVALEDLYVQLIGEKTLKIGKLEKQSSDFQNVNFDVDQYITMTNESSIVLDEVSIPNEVANWICSMSEDRRWLTIREVFLSAPVEATQAVSMSSSQSSISLSLIDQSNKSARLESKQAMVVPAVDYSAGCSARYLPIIVNHHNSSRLSIVMKLPDEFDIDDLLIRRIDQKIIIKGRKKPNLPYAIHVLAQSNIALPAENNNNSNNSNNKNINNNSNNKNINNNDNEDVKSLDDDVKPTTTKTEPVSISSPSIVSMVTGDDNQTTNSLDEASPSFPTLLTRSPSISMGESLPHFNVTIPLPRSALGRTVGAYVTPLKNLVIYAALSLAKRRRLSV